MDKDKTHKTFLSKLFSGSGWALFTMFVWELMEEGIENLIAYVISSAVAIFITKALSTLFIVTATQGIKVSIKRFLMPFIKTLIYKEGDDKMNFFKKIIQFLFANKGTIAEMLVGGVSGFFGAYYLIITYATVPVWALYCISSGVAIILALLAIYIGGETVSSYTRRVSAAKLPTEEKNKLNTIIDSTITAANNTIKQMEKLEAEEKAKAEADAKAKAEAEKLEAEKIAKAKALIAEEKAKAEADAKAIREKAEADAKAKAEAEAKAREDAEIKAIAEKLKAEEAAKLNNL